MRTIPALVVTIGLVASLTACAAPGAGSSSTCAPSGAASEAVSARGAFGSQPDVTVPAGLTATGTQVSVLRQGDGRTIGDGTPVVLEYTLVDGATGEVAQTSGYTGSSNPITAGSTNAGALGEALECAQVGDRLAVAMPKSALSGTAPLPLDGEGRGRGRLRRRRAACVRRPRHWLAPARGRRHARRRARTGRRTRHHHPLVAGAGEGRAAPAPQGRRRDADRGGHRGRQVHRRHVGGAARPTPPSRARAGPTGPARSRSRWPRARSSTASGTP
ncbi:hypothetical protein [Curtobacterium sp. MCJR17_043]|uniref:hypothetical protein n=1 Tax=Curtobacterium sp. MCJR17_043 TaxID=2175660 RepID=UPI0024DF9E9F|nr:hypothetical protein [Curtobacterium sp. MCJR17_043]WIB35008.1 hypothetical protein DEJ15_11010 [Curtobacterium sp. MCJR17_043]